MKILLWIEILGLKIKENNVIFFFMCVHNHDYLGNFFLLSIQFLVFNKGVLESFAHA